MKNLMFFFALLSPVCLAFSAPLNDRTQDGCPPPANLAKTYQSGGTVSFDWDDCSCDGDFHVYYTQNGSASPYEYVTRNSQITVTGLSTGTYLFHFYTDCGGEQSTIIIVEVIFD